MERHILLIDDDNDESDFFMMAQKDMPGLFKFSYLENSPDAVKTITKLQPDVVFLDMNMPAMNGLECLTEIKTKGVSKDVPVILYSTSIDEAARTKAMGLGAIDCIKKPVAISAFQKMLKDVLERL